MAKWQEREFWAALLPFILGILSVTGVLNPNDSTTTQAVSGAVLMVGPAMAYVVMRIIQKIKADQTAANLKIETLKAKLENPPTP